MVLHVRIELLLGKQVAFLVLVHPGADLAVPHQGVAAHLDTVLAAEVRDLVGILPVELALAGLGGLGFHRVLGGDAVELAEDDLDLVRFRDVAVVHGDTDLEVVLVGVLQAVGGLRDGAGTPLGPGRDRTQDQGAKSGNERSFHIRNNLCVVFVLHLQI